jgi:hypothetical protein
LIYFSPLNTFLRKGKDPGGPKNKNIRIWIPKTVQFVNPLEVSLGF